MHELLSSTLLDLVLYTNAVVNLVASSEKVGRKVSAIIGQSVAAACALEDALCAPVPSRSHVVVQTNFHVVAYLHKIKLDTHFYFGAIL